MLWPSKVVGSRYPFLGDFVSRTLEHRDYTLDALRGLAIIGMILVNGAPPTDSIYAPLVHSSWHGWTLADTIFPLFLFAVGVSIALAVKRPGADTDTPARKIYWKIVRRATLLFAINVALVNFPYYDLHRLKLTGVLTHIALCYLVVAVIFLQASWRTLFALIPAVWLIHWALLALLEVPSFGAGNLTDNGNASRYVDQLLLGPHSDSLVESDLDGVLVMFSSITTVLIGVLAGVWVQATRDLPGRIAGMFVAGFALFVLGNIWDLALPINKHLWTGSFVALTGGISLQVFALGYWIFETRGFKAWAKPLQAAGANALALYVFSEGFKRALVYGRVYGVDGSPVRLRHLIYEQLLSPWMPAHLAALVYALGHLLICFAFIAVLYRNRIFVKL